MRLESAQNALRAPPSGKRNGQATNPGSSFSLGLSARQATSAPETTDWRKKLTASAPSDASLNCDRFGGSKRKLTHVAPATAASPTGRSAGAQPAIMSQKMRNSAARVAAGPARPGEAASAGALNGPVQDAKPTRAHRSCGSAFQDSAPALVARRRAIMFHSAGEGSVRPLARGGFGGPGFGAPQLRSKGSTARFAPTQAPCRTGWMATRRTEIKLARRILPRPTSRGINSRHSLTARLDGIPKR
jgi:hypothetical protein